MAAVDVIIFHQPAEPEAGPLTALLAAARAGLAGEQCTGFLAAGASTAVVNVGTPPPSIAFGRRLREAVARHPSGHGLVLLGSGSIPLASPADRRALVAAAGSPGRRALANNRYSADVIALTAEAASALHDVSPDLPGDNALPRWLEESAGAEVTDLRRQWRLAMDLDSPLDVLLTASARGCPGSIREAAAAMARHVPDTSGGSGASGASGTSAVAERIDQLRLVAGDRRAELLIAGRTSATTLRWLERQTACRVRALVEERGLRASTRLAQATARPAARPPASPPARSPARPPRSILGLVLDREGPAALGRVLAGLGDGALVDSRVLLAHRLGPDERAWPGPEDRFASDLLLSERIVDPWLRVLTASAATASIPVVLGGHSLVGPGVRLALRGEAARGRAAGAR